MDNTSKTCRLCQASNREEANYCRNCGTLLEEHCPRCEFAVNQEMYFCDNCGLMLVEPPGYSWWKSQNADRQFFYADKRSSLPAVRTWKGTGTDRDSSQPARIAAGKAIQAAAGLNKPSSAPGSQLQQYIPSELLSKLDAARSSGEMVGERRVVTMLFCDVTGSTAAAEHLDPEEWTDIINGAFEQMIQPVYKYEGTVARLMGDGILAFFGAPIAHEDDPQRAVLAGLDIISGIQEYRGKIRQEQAIALNVRVGINTGMVVVGNVGSDLKMEYTAIGDAINLAARMEQSATPGSVRIAHDTYKLVRNLFEIEHLGEVEVKGKSEPVPAYQVVGRMAVTRRTRGIEGLEVEMVGRQGELEALRKVLADLNQGLGRIVCILGEAGVGKSRLVSEAQTIFQAQPFSGVKWYETTSLSYESNQAYGLFQRLIKSVYDVDMNAPLQEFRERLLPIFEPGEENGREAIQFIEAIFGFENGQPKPVQEGVTFRAELLNAMQVWMKAQFEGQPTVLVFEDMHWSDSASIELLRQLLPITGEIPVAFIFIMRNERQAPSWQIKETADAELLYRYSEIALQPLTEAESNELLSRLLAIADIPEQLRGVVLEKSGGNPFFIEELVRTLIESGVVVSEMREVNGEMLKYWKAGGEEADFEIPDNLQSLLSARLDRLEEATRATLQVASVIGRTFYHRVLQEVDLASQELDKHLSTLLRLEMIREASRMPELEYAFRNPLTQEAVYNTILLKNRRNFHKRVGEAIEELYADRLEAFYGLLAHHFSLAGAPEKAIEYTRLAAKQAANLFAYEEAALNLNAALSMAETESWTDGRIILYEELGDIYHLQRDLFQAITIYNQSVDLLEMNETPDQSSLLRLRRKIVQCSSEAKWNMDLDSYRQTRTISVQSREKLEKDLEAAPVELSNPERVRALAALSFDAWRNQDPPQWEKAQEYAQSAVEIAEQMDTPAVLARALGALANVLDGRSLMRDHASVAQRRLQVSEDLRVEDGVERMEALSGAGMALMYVGEYQKALPLLQETEVLAVEQHNIGQQVAALGLQGHCYFRMDRWDDVLEIEKRWRDIESRHSRARVGPT